MRKAVKEEDIEKRGVQGQNLLLYAFSLGRS
jgi:hypothetical protein